MNCSICDSTSWLDHTRSSGRSSPLQWRSVVPHVFFTFDSDPDCRREWMARINAGVWSISSNPVVHRSRVRFNWNGTRLQWCECKLSYCQRTSWEPPNVWQRENQSSESEVVSLCGTAQPAWISSCSSPPPCPGLLASRPRGIQREETLGRWRWCRVERRGRHPSRVNGAAALFRVATS